MIDDAAAPKPAAATAPGVPGSGWIVVPRPRPEARLRLLAVPLAGGGPTFFKGWAARLPEGVELSAVQLPGRERRLREPLLRRLPAMAEALAEALRPRLDRPVVCFGHSLGAILAYETIRRLAPGEASAVLGLVVSGRAAPGTPLGRAPVHRLPDAGLIKHLRSLGGTRPEILADRDLMALLLPILRADFEAIETFVPQPGPPLACPILALGGDADPEVTPASLAAWAEVTTETFEHHILPGGHFFLVPQETAILGLLSSWMAKLQPGR